MRVSYVPLNVILQCGTKNCERPRALRKLVNPLIFI